MLNDAIKSLNGTLLKHLSEFNTPDENIINYDLYLNFLALRDEFYRLVKGRI